MSKASSLPEKEKGVVGEKTNETDLLPPRSRIGKALASVQNKGDPNFSDRK